ncbi:AsmA protein [Chitinophaga costaii]|uniref:AsmA protein n=1 Tax=Chitinophaga costaii TaxID=1335309 RepID=A0A1C4EYI3_9BACT|nr:AsmA-like C-terminal region-containing protein [Chitinophaga costaii]PUZ21545.1 AsmA family protein [Chitinophaga costaii]SCC48707.1 AsmA protein [Chitinophaga costaii]
MRNKTILKTFKIFIISVAVFFGLLFLLPILFPTTISNKIKTWTNKSITGEMNFSRARLSFFNHFPSLTLALYDFTLKGAAPFKQDTLVSANEVALGVNLASLFSGSLKINKIFLTEGNVHVLVDAAGHPNYDIYKASPAGAQEAENDSSSASLRIERIQFSHCNIIYDDRSLPMYIRAKEVNYTGAGDLSKAQFDLRSAIRIGSFDLSYAGTPYVKSKQLDGELITKINTQSLDLIFEKNDLKINELPVRLNGSFGFLKNGYRMDFKLSSMESSLHAIFSALPPEYITWLDHTDVEGSADVTASLSGQYIAATNTMPDLAFNMKVRDGVISNNKAPAPIRHAFLNFESRLPQLNMDSLYVNVDSIYFNIDKDFFSAIIRVKGLQTPDVHVNINTDIDLEKWNKAIGGQAYEMKGRLQAQLQADGRYATSVVYKGLQHKADTVLASIPAFHLQSTFRNGYFKYVSLPAAVDNISFHVEASCPDNDYAHTKLNVEDINARLLSNYIKGYFRLSNAQAPLIDAQLGAVLHLADVQQCYKTDSLAMGGDLHLNVVTKGSYLPAKRLFPVTTARLIMNNGSVQTKYYPSPLQNIQVDATVTNTTGTMRSLNVNLKPVAFELEGQPFTLQADLNNFDDLRYRVTSQGVIDLGKIYKVFAVKGYDLDGFIKTNLALSGTQRDAMNGHYDKLHNKGSLVVKDIALKTELYPLPFIIKNGTFRFDQDKMVFDQFNASYGKSLINLNGYLNNMIAYATLPHQKLQGQLNLKSNYILVDEMMVNGAPVENAAPVAASGVVMVPDNLGLTLQANVKKISFKGVNIDSFYGQVVIDSSKLRMNNTGFHIIGAPVEMEAVYAATTPDRATFDYRINAHEFDIKRAYNEIKIFHDLASSAAGASGVVGLDYHLSGRLDKNMNPVYPSIKGEGVLSVKKVKMKGFRLFNAVSSATGKDDVKDPDLSKVDIKSTINNNIITIARTKMKVAGFRPRFEGQVSLDGKLNMTGRLGLPPLGIFGIPFTVTGTQSSPKVQLRRGKEQDKLEETEDDH